MASILTLRFKTLTPLFLGGADQAPELRAPSFKGLLRFWYRAVDPAFGDREYPKWPNREERFFGGTANGAGQSPFLLRILPAQPPATQSWQDCNSRRFNQGQGRQTRNGLVYLGYPFGMRGGERQAIAPGQEFSIQCVVTREQDNPDFRRALLAAWWLLGHVGAAGSRSRRGFGGLALTDWSFSELNHNWPERDQLPLLCQASSATEWDSGFRQALSTFEGWFGKSFEHASHPHLGNGRTWTLSQEGYAPGQWDQALNDMGRRMQDFRLRRQPDYDDVKAHLQRRQPMIHAPGRASFGLPLTFRFGGTRGEVTFTPYDTDEKTTRERQGSLLLLRLVAVGNRLHPLYLRLDGDVPGGDSPVAVRGHGRPLSAAKENTLDEFMNHLRRNLDNG